jgi:ABC-2 type transport system ATP-binding protein
MRELELQGSEAPRHRGTEAPRQRNGQIAVQVKGLRRTFGDFVAVDDIDLSVHTGEVFGFLGPNGAGKSTTIRMLCGLLMPTGGEGTVGGHDILKEPEAIKKIIGYMSQRFSLYDDLTVEENINFFGGVYSVPQQKLRERKEWVIEMAGLGGERRTLTRNLAGGFKQRLALGCAVLHEPPILFLDEPTSGVDPLSRRNFWSLIGGMSQAGATVFVTTHYMDEADYCDRLALIYRGRIIAEGSPGQLRRSQEKAEVFEIEVKQPLESAELLGRHGIDAALFGSTLHVTTGDAAGTLPVIERILKEAGIKVLSAVKVTPSLEDVFVAMIEGSK